MDNQKIKIIREIRKIAKTIICDQMNKDFAKINICHSINDVDLILNDMLDNDKSNVFLIPKDTYEKSHLRNVIDKYNIINELNDYDLILIDNTNRSIIETMQDFKEKIKS